MCADSFDGVCTDSFDGVCADSFDGVCADCYNPSAGTLVRHWNIFFDSALAHIRRAWPGADRIEHQRRVRMAAVTASPSAPSPDADQLTKQVRLLKRLSGCWGKSSRSTSANLRISQETAGGPQIHGAARKRQSPSKHQISPPLVPRRIQVPPH